MKLRAQADTAGVEKLMTNVPKSLRFRFLDALDHIGRSFYKTFNERNLSGRPYIQAGERPSIRQRFKFNVLRGAGEKDFGVHIFFTRSRVARRHEYGETITGPGGRRVAVPLSARGDVLFYKGRVRSRFRRTVNRQSNIRPIKFKDGQWYLARVRKKRGQEDEITPLFVLKDKVVIPPRLKFFATYRELSPKFQGYLRDALTQGVQEGIKGA